MPLNRRLPKRGFNHSERHPLTQVNIDVIAEHFDDGAEITLATLLGKHVIKKGSSGVKVLGRGDLKIGVQVRAHAFSSSAIEKIQAAGGTAEALK